MIVIPLSLTIIFVSILVGIGSGIYLAVSKEQPRWAEVTVMVSMIAFLLGIALLLYYANSPELW